MAKSLYQVQDNEDIDWEVVTIEDVELMMNIPIISVHA